MIIPKGQTLTDQQFAEIKEITAEFNIEIQVIKGRHRTIYAMIGDERAELLVTRIEGLPYIDRVDSIQSKYKLMAKGTEMDHHEVHIGGRVLGRGEFTVIAGHCTIDPDQPNLYYESVAAIKEAGADMIRGGVWKPRTLPSSYQGDRRALDILIEAKQRTGLPIVMEVMDDEQLQIAVEAGVDVLQVGARNALNYSLLKQIGSRISDHPDVGVLLKRGMHMGKLDEFISAAEYIVSKGNPNVLLCPRGTQPAMDGYRNHPDECITPLLKERTWAPVVVDPSHSVGKAMYVPHACLSAVAYGADGLVIECHIDPKHGIGDDPKQAVTPKVLESIIKESRSLHEVARGFLNINL